MTTTVSTPLDVIILAAGKGTRLQSQLPKVLHPLFEQPLLRYVVDAAVPLSPHRIIVVVGHDKERVTEAVEAMATDYPSINFVTVTQEPQQGTGHAVQCVAKAVPDLSPTALLLSGDVPLVTTPDLATLLSAHQQGGHAVTVMGADVPTPTGYGRLLTSQGNLTAIVEEKDASDDERRITQVNAGLYALDTQKTLPLLANLSNSNAQGEWYITDVVALSLQANHTVGSAMLADWHSMQGVNNRADLARCMASLNERHVNAHMANGVTVVSPASTFIGPNVAIGADTMIYPGCFLAGHTTIGPKCTIGPNTRLTHAAIGQKTTITESVITDSAVGDNALVGPFAHIRNGAVLGNQVRLGNFVEVKNTTVGDNTNAAHLAYLGDATVGQQVNIGAGTIIANYDPVRKQKHPTTVGDGAMVGCNSVLVAPVQVGDNACVAAGSVITQPVSDNALAVARAKGKEIPHWVTRQQKAPSQTA